jgi:ComF family protein
VSRFGTEFATGESDDGDSLEGFPPNFRVISSGGLESSCPQELSAAGLSSSPSAARQPVCSPDDVAGMSLPIDGIAALARLLAPERCPGCDFIVATAGFCEACELLLEPVARDRGSPRKDAAAFAYGGPLADALRRLKYGRRPELGRVLGRIFAESAVSYAGSVDRVVPVPLHPRRLRERGFNQSALLAAPVARALGVALDTRGLRRVRMTRDQAGLRKHERLANVHAAFVATRQTGRVLLIDDVRTTGATLSAASNALSAAGCVEVHTLAMAVADD